MVLPLRVRRVLVVSTIVSSLGIAMALLQRTQDLLFRRLPPRFWVRPYLRARHQFGAMNNQFHVLFRKTESEFRYIYPHDLRSFMRVSTTQFYEILEMVKDDISSNNSLARDAISPKEKLVVTLRHLVGGESHKDLELYFMIGRPTITKFIPVVLKALIKHLGPIYGRLPRTENAWLDIERGFANRWGYVNTVGALDGKHVIMMKPRSSGSTCFNYKSSFSINLMGIVGHNYKFIGYDIGSPGRMSDAGIWNFSPLRAIFNPSENQNPMNIPPPHVLISPHKVPDSRNRCIEYHLIADDGFGLTNRLMKPYSGNSLSVAEEVFNYRLSRARQVVEVAFGILVNRFRALLKRLYCSTENARLIVEACVLLHNYLIHHNPVSDHDAQIASDIWYQKLEKVKARNYAPPPESAIQMRDFLQEYFLSEYPIDSQWDNI